jgi:hypothetical protein
MRVSVFWPRGAQIAVVLSKSHAAVKELLINKFRKINWLCVPFLLPWGTGFVYRFYPS